MNIYEESAKRQREFAEEAQQQIERHKKVVKKRIELTRKRNREREEREKRYC
jgi:hypothetical protein